MELLFPLDFVERTLSRPQHVGEPCFKDEDNEKSHAEKQQVFSRTVPVVMQRETS
jgi:hypothetical protein